MKVVSSFGIANIIPHSCKLVAICRSQGSGTRGRQKVRSQEPGVREKEKSSSPAPNYLPLTTKQGEE